MNGNITLNGTIEKDTPETGNVFTISNVGEYITDFGCEAGTIYFTTDGGLNIGGISKVEDNQYYHFIGYNNDTELINTNLTTSFGNIRHTDYNGCQLLGIYVVRLITKTNQGTSVDGEWVACLFDDDPSLYSIIIHIGDKVNPISVSDTNTGHCQIGWNLSYNTFANNNNYITDIFDRFYNAKINNIPILVEFSSEYS